jgi:hypothetical protein
MQPFWFIPSLRCELDGAFARLCPVLYTFVYDLSPARAGLAPISFYALIGLLGFLPR